MGQIGNRIGGLSRRQFISLGTGAMCATMCAQGVGTPSVDPNLSVFLSDLHVSGRNVKGQPTYQNPLFAKVVDQILAMNPRPKNALVFGDVALWNGLSADYAESAPHLRRLEAAGITLTVTTGNHDHRAPFLRAFPRQAKISPVAGRTVSVIDLGTADFVLLDSLDENPNGEGSGNPVPGTLDEKQGEWLLEFASAAKRPFLIGAHHPPGELSVRQKPLLSHFEKNPYFVGYVHGHDHRWCRAWKAFSWGCPRVVPSVCLPSTGWWGNIGFATFRTEADRATLAFVQNDFFFPKPLPPGAARPRQWEEILRENAHESCTFAYSA